MTARDVADIFSRIETLLLLHGEDEFRARAYGRAARALETSGADVEEAVAAGRETALPGIGKGLAAEVRAIVETGSSSQLEELVEKTPPGLLDILRVRGLGAKKVRAIHQQLGIETLAGLEEAARDGRLGKLSGFGAKSAANILGAIEELRRNAGRFRIDVATAVAMELGSRLTTIPGLLRVDPVGRTRRGYEEYDHVALLLTAEEPAPLLGQIASSALLDAPLLDDGLVSGLFDGVPVRLHATTPSSQPAALLRLTGSTDHVFMVEVALEARGLELRDEGLVRDGEGLPVASEEEIYAAAGMDPVPPELREGIDEVRRALDQTLPSLVTAADVRGMLHVHSTWSDGRQTIEEMAERVRSLGYRYLLMCDHSKSAFYANGLDERRLMEQGREIDELNRRYDPAEFRILKGIECDILHDGTLDFDDDTLASLDAVVASIHSRFELDRETQTERLCQAIEHPSVTIVGHPTGRKILIRQGYAIDFRRVIDCAAEHGTAIEINASPYRLDLTWRMVRYALRRGVRIAVNPDAHSFSDLENMRHGITIARKGGVTPASLLNALEVDDFLAFARTRTVTSAS